MILVAGAIYDVLVYHDFDSLPMRKALSYAGGSVCDAQGHYVSHGCWYTLELDQTERTRYSAETGFWVTPCPGTGRGEGRTRYDDNGEKYEVVRTGIDAIQEWIGEEVSESAIYSVLQAIAMERMNSDVVDKLINQILVDYVAEQNESVDELKVHHRKE